MTDDSAAEAAPDQSQTDAPADASAREVRLREMAVSWLPIQTSFVFGVRF